MSSNASLTSSLPTSFSRPRPASTSRNGSLSLRRASSISPEAFALRIEPMIRTMSSGGTYVVPHTDSPRSDRNAVVGKPPRLYRSETSGLLSMSTLTGTKLSFTRRATSGTEYVVESMTWHQWHHEAVRSRSTSLPLFLASSKTSFDQSFHRISEPCPASLCVMVLRCKISHRAIPPH